MRLRLSQHDERQSFVLRSIVKDVTMFPYM